MTSSFFWYCNYCLRVHFAKSKYHTTDSSRFSVDAAWSLELVCTRAMFDGFGRFNDSRSCFSLPVMFTQDPIWFKFTLTCCCFSVKILKYKMRLSFRAILLQCTLKSLNSYRYTEPGLNFVYIQQQCIIYTNDVSLNDTRVNYK